MTIEITKKGLIKVGIVFAAFAIIVLCGFGIYSWGFGKGYESGVADTTHKYENPKGNGINFYAEEFNESRGSFNGMSINHQYMIYHSTPNCKAIVNGVARDRAYTDSTYRMSNSKFCPKCMDNTLIRKCEIFWQGDFGK